VYKTHELKEIMNEILSNTKGLPVIFPIHPRTAKIIQSLNINAANLHIVEPLGYLEFKYLVQHAKAVITDSGGITEKTTVMNVPCLTLRDNT
jgi:UDP-N-acetylglucosamine 2-epimerase (non-hydrolysing)